jgi:Transposase DDE domain group 1
MAETSQARIHKLEVTDDCLTSRGGLAFFVQYVQKIGVVGLLLSKFAHLKKSVKGVSVENLFLQVLYFFLDGTSRHISYFDELQKEQGYQAVVEMPERQMASSHTIKRFFRAFTMFHAATFRWVLQELFVWRLQLARQRVVMLTLDTMVMDNDEAQKRQGCDPTYKKVKGFQPLQLIWEGKIVDAIFRRGKRHSNYGNDVAKMLRGIVSLIRSRCDASTMIIIRFDCGFFDEENFALCDELGIGFIATGKMLEAIKQQVAAIPEKKWEAYDNGRQVWNYARFFYRCESWDKAYRALYTRPQYQDQQRVLDFARPDNIILSNLAAGEPVLEKMPRDRQKYWLEDETLIFHHHQRGADELPHRGLKEFSSEQLPFKRFAANQAYYYLMLISFFIFESFKQDILKEIMPLPSYATTVRRKLIDIAAKIVRTGREVILKVTQAVMERLQLETVWVRCHSVSAIPIPT